MRYLNLKQLRKLLSEAAKKNARFQEWWLEKANMQLIFFFPPTSRMRWQKWSFRVCEAEMLRHNQGCAAPSRTRLTRNVLPPVHGEGFSRLSKHCRWILQRGSVCWRKSSEMFGSEVEFCLNFNSGSLNWQWWSWLSVFYHLEGFDFALKSPYMDNIFFFHHDVVSFLLIQTK